MSVSPDARFAVRPPGSSPGRAACGRARRCARWCARRASTPTGSCSRCSSSKAAASCSRSARCPACRAIRSTRSCASAASSTRAGVRAVLLFGIPDAAQKDAYATVNYDPNGVVQRAGARDQGRAAAPAGDRRPVQLRVHRSRALRHPRCGRRRRQRPHARRAGEDRAVATRAPASTSSRRRT